jgi:hypothetical protein
VLGREQEDVERKSGARGLGMTFLWPRRHRERKGVEIPVQRHQVGKDGGAWRCGGGSGGPVLAARGSSRGGRRGGERTGDGVRGSRYGRGLVGRSGKRRKHSSCWPIVGWMLWARRGKKIK